MRTKFSLSTKKTIKDYKAGNIKAYDNIKDLRASLDEI